MTRLYWFVLLAVAIFFGVPLALCYPDGCKRPAKVPQPVVYAQVLPKPVATPAPVEAPQKYTDEQRARWACSAAIEDRATVRGSISWTRRSQWPAVHVGLNEWRVVASYRGDNAFGARISGMSECHLKEHPDGTFSVRRVVPMDYSRSALRVS